MKGHFGMKRVFLIAFAIMLGSAAGTGGIALAGEKSETGLGIVIGEPSGLNGQFFWSSRSAIDVTAAWSWRDWLFTAVDYQRYDYIMDAPREWKWTYGVGGYLTFPESDDGTFGLRIPLGLRYHFPHSNIAVWGEFAPALEILPDTSPQLQAGIGITYWIQ
jgi:hypothetical protein